MPATSEAGVQANRQYLRRDHVRAVVSLITGLEYAETVTVAFLVAVGAAEQDGEHWCS
jgi:hypothetical protein